MARVARALQLALRRVYQRRADALASDIAPLVLGTLLDPQPDVYAMLRGQLSRKDAVEVAAAIEGVLARLDRP